jgi:hypothetical protein
MSTIDLRHYIDDWLIPIAKPNLFENRPDSQSSAIDQFSFQTKTTHKIHQTLTIDPLFSNMETANMA